MKKKYTVVYSERLGSSLSNRVTMYKYIETENLLKSLEDFPGVWFVFDGHCMEAHE